MPEFSQLSLSRLDTCDDRLQVLFKRVVLGPDCSVLCGHREKEAQNEAFRTGRSKVQWPDGNHNKLPSDAVDVAPYPIDWPGDEATEGERIKAYARYYLFAGYVLGVAWTMGIPIRWGGDWDGDYVYTDQTFDDLVHFEIDE